MKKSTNHSLMNLKNLFLIRRFVFLYLLLAVSATRLLAQAPTISSFSPASGNPGTLVTITGTNLGTPTAFTIGGTAAIVVSNTGTTLVGMVMPGSATGSVSITTSGGTVTGSGTFTITSTPYPSAQQGSKLVGTGATGAALQGISVAMSADGNTAIVGGYSDNSNVGAVWIYTRSGGSWTQQGTKLVGTGNTGASQQGSSVALSADGNTALVGGRGDNSNAGAVWVFTRSGTTWSQQGSKLVGTGAVGAALQGFSVSLSADGNTAMVGGCGDNSNAGAAWVFTRSGTTWTQQGSKLVGTGAVGGAYQGWSVALSSNGTTAMVGASQDNAQAGAAWVYTRSGTTWTQQGSKLVGTGAVGAAQQGMSVSLSADGNTGSVGGYGDNSAVGAAWVYTRSGSTWTQQGTKLVGTGAVGASTQGVSVSLSADGNTAFIGGYNDNSFAGANWIFTRSGSTWTQQGSKLIGTSAVGTVARQGAWVAMSADGRTAISGAFGDNSNAGAAWVYAAVTNTITYDGNTNTGGTVPAVTTGANATTVTLATNSGLLVKTGYTFAGWNTLANGTGTSYAAGASYTLAGNVTLYAQWTANTLTVTYDSQGGSAIASGTTTTGASITASPGTPTRTGYTFNGWFVASTGGTAITFPYTHGKTADFTLYAQWTINNYTITFNGNGSTAGTMAAQTIAFGASANLTANAFTRTGFTFIGWGTTTTSGVVYDNLGGYTMGTANVTIYAQWAANNTVTFNGNGSTAGTMTAQTIASGLSANLTANAFTRTGFTFIGWGTTTTGRVVYTNSASYTMGASNVTLYAQWTSNFTVTFNGNGSTAGTMAAQTIGSGLSANLTANAFTRTSYTFIGWNTASDGSGDAYANSASYTMGASNVTLYAQWTSNFTVTFNGNGSTAGTMAAQTIGSGLSANLTANAFTRTGFTFIGWGTTTTGGVVYTNSASYTMGASNVTLYAQWTSNFTVTFNGNGSTAGTMAAQTIGSGLSANLTSNAFTRTGFTFTGWNTAANGSGFAYANLDVYTMGMANVTLYAQWATNYTVTFNANGGTGSTAAKVIGSGLSAPLTANAFTRTGFTFTGWNTATDGSGDAYANLDIYTMGTANVTLYAQWTPSYTITFNANGGTGTMAAQTIGSGLSANLTANAFTRSGYVFAGWGTTPTIGVEYANSDNYNMGVSNVTLYAQWAKTITFNANGGTGTMASQNIIPGFAASLNSNTFTRAGYTVVGWGTSPTSGVVYSNNAVYTMGAANVTLYMQWTANNYTITFNANGGTGTMANQTIATDASAILTANAFTRTGYVFAGWGTTTTSGVVYTDGFSYTMGTSNTTLYAQWLPLPDAPTGLTATPGINRVSLSFTAPTNNGGSAITNYQYSTDNGTSWTALSPASTATEIVVSGLTNCTAYNILVRAVNSAGAGAPSTAVSATPRTGVGAGTDWTIRTSAADNIWRSVTYGNGLFVAVADFGTGNRVMTSPDGITWTIRTSAEDNDWRSVAYGNGLFVAVASAGTGNRVMTSPDGITWTSRSSPTSNFWQSVTYGNGLFVAVAQSGTGTRVMTSPDGINWTIRTSAANYFWMSVTYGNGLFVAVARDGTGNRVMTSPDGITWTARTSAADNEWFSVTYGNGLFVAVAYSGTGNRVMTSPNGINWTIRNSAADNQWYSVSYGNGLFVAVANTGTGNRVMTSPNGINWTIRNSAANNQWFSVTYGNGLFVAVAGSGTGDRVMTSSDLLTPEMPVTGSITPSYTSIDLAFTAPASVGGSAISNYEYSIDGGSSWVTRSPASTASPLTISGLTQGTAYQVQLRAVNAQGSGCASATSNITTTAITPAAPTGLTATPGINRAYLSFTVPGNNGGGLITNYQYSTDNGASWTAVSPASTATEIVISGLSNCTDYNIMVRAVNSAGAGAPSTAVLATPRTGVAGFGTNWTLLSSALNNRWQSVTYGNGLFVAVASFYSNNLLVMTSPDGINWTSRGIPANNDWKSVTYGNGLFVAVASTGTGNRVMTSPDGITWNIRNSATDNNWTSVTYGNGLFVAVASTGTGNRVMTSPDGITWTSRTSATNNNWNSVTYGNGLFVAVAENSVMTSPDGITWSSQTSAGNNIWKSVTYGNGRFVAVASTGTGNRVMTSPNGITWSYSNYGANNQWQSVTYGIGLFVAVAHSIVMTSPDGITWTVQPSPQSNFLSVTYFNGRFVVVGNQGINAVYGVVMTSSDLLAPDRPEITGIIPSGDYASVAFTAPASVGGSAISNYEYSINGGSSWVTRSPASTASPLLITGLTPLTAYPVQLRALNTQGSGCPSATTNTTTTAITVPSAPTGLTASSGMNSASLSFTAPGNDGGGIITNYQYSTDNGTSWTAVSPASTATTILISGLNNCTAYNILVRAVNSAGAGAPSTAVSVTIPLTTTVWTSRTAAADNDWNSVTYGNGLFVAVASSGTGNRVMTSPDGITWTSRTAAADNDWNSVTYGNGLFVAVASSGTGNRVMTSPDGITWTLRNAAADNFWTSITYGNGLFVAVAATGSNRVMTSPDGVTWTIRTSAWDSQWSSVIYGNGLFVAVSPYPYYDRVMTSPDGITWTIQSSVPNIDLNSVTYGNGLFVAVAGFSAMSSPDGITWTLRTTPGENTWRGVTYGNGLFVAVAWSTTFDQVMTSPDGITWTSRTTAGDNRWKTVTYGNGLFVAVATLGTGDRVITSPGFDASVPVMPVITGITPAGDYASMSFTAPASVGGSAISNYEYSINGGSSWVTRSPAATTSPLLITGLTPLTAYPVQLRAVNTQGSGCPSATTNITTTAITVPDAPTWLTARPGINRASLSFTAPDNDGGGSITNYEYSTNNGASWTVSPAYTATEIVISGLTNCTAYNTMVRAVNRAGAGAPSTAVSVITRTGVGAATNWTIRTSAADNGWNSVTYGNGLFVAVATNNVMTSPDGINWTIRTSAAGNIWRSVTYANGLFVAVASTGTSNRVMTSPDGITWTSRTSAADNYWNSVTYGNGLFVAVASSGTGNRVMTSPDGITWTIRSSAADSDWRSVTYGNGLFVAVAENIVMTSPDGINWTIRTPAAEYSWQSVTYGNGLFVAVAMNGIGNGVMTSPDGINWTGQTSAADNYWNSVTYGNGLFVAVAWGIVMTSPDGITWTVPPSPAGNFWLGVTYGNGLFVAVPASGTGNQVMTSPGFDALVPVMPVITGITPAGDYASMSFTAPASVGGSAISNYEYSINGGSSWVTRSPAATTSPLLITGLTPLTAYPVQLRALNTQGSGCPSATTNITTTAITVPDAPTGLIARPGINRVFLSFTAPGNNGGTAITNYEYSTNNGTSWTAVSPASTATEIVISGLSNCTAYNIMVRAVNSVGAGAPSTAVSVTPRSGVAGVGTGANWTTRSSAAGNQWQSITYGNGLFVAVAISGTGNRVMTSPDGITWTSRTSAADNDWRSVTYGNGLFVAVATTGTGNRVMTSPDGVNWAIQTSAANNAWNSVTYGNGLFVAVASSGTGNRVMTSPDGINWTIRTSAANYSWRSVTYGNGLFVAVAMNGVMTSPNGITWTIRTSAANNDWYSVTYGNGLFVAVALSGTNRVMTSPDGITWTSRTPAANNSWWSVTYGNGLFVAVAAFSGTGNRVMTSLDGINWTSRTSAADNNWVSVTYGNGLFVAVAMSSTFNQFNQVMTSPDFDAVVPERPVTGSITPSYTSIDVAFTAPANVGGSAISNYEYSINDGSSWVTRSPAATTSPLTISGLTQGTAYQVQLRAVNTEGSGCASSTLNTTTLSSTLIVTYDSQGGSAISNGSTTSGASIEVSPGTPTRAGYTFNGWFAAATGGTAISFPYAHGQTADFTLYAQWTANSLTITYDSQEGSAISSGNTTTGASIADSPGTPTREGYTFNGWFTAPTGGEAVNFPYAHGQTADFTLYAQWTANSLTVTYDSQEGSAVSSGNTTTGASIAASPGTPTREGYTFNGWFTAPTGGEAVNFPYAHGQTADFTLYAQWTANSLTVTYDSQEGSAISSGNTTTDASIEASPGTPTREGYTFNGWFLAATGGTAISFPYAHGQTADFTLYAQWTANSLTVNYDSQGGSAISNGTTTTGASIAASPGTPTRAGYTFKGWFAATTGGTAISFPYAHGQTANFTLYAQWTANTLTVTYNSQGGTPISSSSTTTGASIAASPGTPTREGYTFNGWFTAPTGGEAVNFPYAHGQTADFTLYAQWTANSLTVTYDSQEGSAISSGNTTTDASIEASPGTPTREGYTFNGWFLAATGGTAISFPYAHGQTADFTLYAQWTANSLTVNYDSQGGSAISNGTTTTGASIAASPGTPTRAGYTFKGWFAATTGGTAISFPYAHGQTANFTLYAQWTANTLTVTYDSQGGSAISSGTTTIDASIAASPGTPTRTGYTFNGWFAAATGGTAISFPYAHGQTTDFTLYAQWTANSLTVTYDSQEGSAISSGNTTTGASIEASPGTPTRAGYTFNGWFLAATGGTAISFPYAHGQTTDFTLYAQWALPPTISSFAPASGNPGTLVTITGTDLSPLTSLTIGGVPAIVVSNSGTTLVAMVMPGATTGSVSIINAAGGSTGSGTFTVTSTPYPSVQQGSKLVGTGAIGAALQGISVAMSADGNTAIVGGYSDNSNVGAVWIYTRSGGSWTQQGTKLVGTGNTGASQQGSSVALSADGNTALVGGRGDNSNVGAVWVFTRTGSTWSQQGTKLVGTGAISEALQGFSVSLSADGNTAMIGGCGDNSYAGAAWVFTRSGTTWTQQGSKLVGTGAVGGAYQGWSVALSSNGTTAMVGASQDNAQAGAAWVYTRSGTTWTQQGSKLVGTGAVGAAQQGMSVSLSADGNTGSVGGYGDNSEVGAAWVYTRSGTTWTQQGTKLVGTGAVGTSTQGVSVSLSADGNTAFIGGYNDNSFAGANWVFTRSGSTWTQQGSKLIGTSAVGTAARQGAWVAMSADGRTVISGAFGDNSNAGAAWVYVVSNTITYDGNANTGGTVPAVTTGANASTVTLATNSGLLVKTGYTFAGWNTLADGTGTSYAAGASYTLAGNVTLYAQWTVDSRPTAVISGSQTICAGTSATLSIAVSGTGPWSGTLSDGQSFSGSTSPISVSVSPTTNTTYTVATLNDINGAAIAGDMTGSAEITLNARPTAVISGSQTICAGTSATLSIAVSGTGPWSGTFSDGQSFSGSTSPINVTVSPSSTTTYTVATLSDANCTSVSGDISGSATITVNERPTAVLSGGATYCANQNTATSLSIAVTGNGPWSGTLSNGQSFSGSTSPISVSVTPSSTTTYTVATLSDANCTAVSGDISGSATITVNERPTAVLSGGATYCANQNTTTSLSIAVTGNGPWSGTLSNGQSFSGSTSPISVSVSPSSTTTYSVATLSDANCTAVSGDISGSATITVNERPTAVLSGGATYCANQNTTTSLSIAVTGNGPWSGTLSNGQSFSGSTSPISVSVTPSSTTTYTLATLSDANCTAVSGDLSGSAIVTIITNPVAPTATVVQPTCSVATGTINVTGPLGVGFTYSIGGAYQSSLTFSGVQPGAYNVSVQNSSGCSSAQATSVTVNAQPFIPVVPNVTGQTNVCNVVGTGVAVSFTANSAGATSYTWTLPANTILVSGQGTATVAVKFLSGFTTQANKQIKVTATSVCGTSTQKTYYLSAQLPGTPAQIVASTTDVCPSLGTNVPVTYKIPKVMGAAGYIWAAQAGTTILTPSSNWGENDTVIAVNFANNFTSSIVTVQSFNDCGVSGTRSLTIYRNNPATPGLISGPANACAYIGTNGADVTYSVSAVSGVTAYNWTLPSGVTNVTGQGTNSISFRYPAGFTSGILSVRSSNGCGTSGTRSLSISTLTPSYPGRIDVINLAACPSRIYSYTISSMPSNAVSLLWTVPAGGSIVSGQGTTSIVVEYTSGVIAGNVGVVAVANCGNSLPRVTEVKLAACPSGLTSPIAMKNDNNTEDKNLEVKVYPNPTTAEFRMQVITAGRNELSVKIMDVQGRNIRSFVVAPNQTTAFGNELKAGVYMLEVREGKRVRTERVVKY